RARFDLGRVQEREERRLPGIAVSDDDDPCHRFRPTPSRTRLAAGIAFGASLSCSFGPGRMSPDAGPAFDPMEPFAKEDVLRELLGELERFDYKLYGPIPIRFHRGEPTKYEFDLNLGLVHFTEQDFEGLSEI